MNLCNMVVLHIDPVYRGWVEAVTSVEKIKDDI